ncbi:MAG: amino acid permease, partial [Simkaniaceae bacterium]|nr:amino acid permease [Simkaniaceae bacterium]
MAKSKRSLTVFMLAMINVAAICSIKNWALTAEYGFSSLFYYFLGVALFLIPCSLVAAELASAWPEKGGIFVWVKKALGHKLAFLAVWLLWAENLFYYPTLLSFLAASLAYIFKPALAGNAIYTFCIILSAFWAATLINLRGIKTSGWISSLGVIAGTIIPGLLIIVSGIVWFAQGRPLEIDFSWGTLIPKLSSGNDLALLAGMLLGFAGMEMSAVHARDVVNPQKNYPKAIMLSALIIIILSVLGTLAIGIMIPKGEINIISSAIETIKIFLVQYHVGWLTPVMAFLIAFGAFGTLNTWTVGPVRGLLAAADNGELPPIFHRVNKHNMPSFMMILQAIVVSIVSLLFLFSKSVNESFWILIVIAAQLYIIMYALMFIS